MIIKRWYAKVYGWTPQQVGELSLDEVAWFPIIEEAANQASEALQDK